MKKLSLFALIFSLFPISIAFALPNPAATYCIDRGYTLDDGNCYFPDNTYCPQWEFYNGECGTDYVKKLSFSDIEGSKYQSAIEYVLLEKIVNGYDDGTYRPNNLINRAEFTKIIVEALYSSDEFESFADELCFPDILQNQWFTKYVCFAKDRGIINGYPDNTFRPTDNINYVEALKVILEAYTKKDLMKDVDILYTGAGLTSEGTYSLPWYYNYVQFANDENLSFSANIENDQLITRGETAEIIMWIDTVTK